MSSSDSMSFSNQQVTNQQATAGEGGAAIGTNSNGNIINVTSSDVNALQANQNVSETAINAEGSTAAYALQALEQSQANSNVVVGAVVDANDAAAHDAENTAAYAASESQSVASQAISATLGGGQSSFTSAGTVNDASDTVNNIALYLGIGVAVISLIYYFRQK